MSFWISKVDKEWPRLIFCCRMRHSHFLARWSRPLEVDLCPVLAGDTGKHCGHDQLSGRPQNGRQECPLRRIRNFDRRQHGCNHRGMNGCRCPAARRMPGACRFYCQMLGGSKPSPSGDGFSSFSWHVRIPFEVGIGIGIAIGIRNHGKPMDIRVWISRGR
jgi:hypothetical protein